MQQLVVCASLAMLASTVTTGGDPYPLCLDEFDSEQTCELVLGSRTAVIDTGGTIAFPDGTQLDLPIPNGFHAQLLKYHLIGGELLLIVEISDVDSGSTLVTKVNLEIPSISWSTEVPGFNPSLPLVTDHAVYIGAIGTIAKLDAVTGRVLWMHNDLFEPDTQAYNGFELPRINDQTVVFVERKSPVTRHDRLRQVVADDVTGSIFSK